MHYEGSAQPFSPNWQNPLPPLVHGRALLGVESLQIVTLITERTHQLLSTRVAALRIADAVVLYQRLQGGWLTVAFGCAYLGTVSTEDGGRCGWLLAAYFLQGGPRSNHGGLMAVDGAGSFLDWLLQTG